VTVATDSYVRLIRASLAGYLGRATGELAAHELAVESDPGFARYRLDLAECLLRHGQRERARQLLLELADGSVEFAAAAVVVQRSWPEQAEQLLGPATMRALQRIEVDTIDAGIGVPTMFAAEPRRAAMPKHTTAIAVLVPQAGSEREFASLLAELEAQTLAAGILVVVAVPPGAASTAAQVGASRAMRCLPVTVAAGSGWAERLNACAMAAPAPLLFVMLPGDRLRPDALAVMAAELEAHPQAGLVFANQGWTEHDPVHFEPSACAAFSCPPPHAHRHLGDFAGIGGHALWRRELHERHGWFEPRWRAAAEYEFRLRAVRGRPVRQLPLLLTIGSTKCPWWAARDPATDPAALADLRRSCGSDSSAPVTRSRRLPAPLLAPGIAEEATSHARLGLLPESERRDLTSLERFYGTALLHGDLDTALGMLRAAIANAPTLLSPRLAYVDLATLHGGESPAALHDVLLEARRHHPYASVLDRRLAAEHRTRQIPLPIRVPDQELPCPC
jgi:hypothetical protein